MEHYHGHRQRLREKFLENSSALADYEILELVLSFAIPRKDVKPIAKELIRHAGSIATIFSCKISEVDGAGPQTDFFFSVMAEFFARIQIKKVKSKPSVSGPKDIFDYMRYIIGYAPHEKAGVIFLNAKNCIVTHQIIAEGIVNSTSIFPRTVVELAIKHNAAGVVLVHNHPSGDSAPSKADIEMTKVVSQALELLNVKL